MTDEPLLKLESPSDSQKPLPFGHHGKFRVCVASEEDLPKCWHLVYQKYVASGYEKPGSFGYRYGIHDAIPGTGTFLIEDDGEPIGTVTVYPDSILGLPADHIYKLEMDDLRAQGRKLVEVGRFAIRRDYERERYILTTLLEMTSIYARSLMRATDMVITVNPSHVKFYERVLLFDRIGEEKSLDSVGGAPAVLMRMDLRFQEQVIRWEHGEGVRPEKLAGKRATFYRHGPTVQEEAEKAAVIGGERATFSERFLRKYFVDERPLLPESSRPLRRYFEACYSGYNLAPSVAWENAVTEEVPSEGKCRWGKVTGAVNRAQTGGQWLARMAKTRTGEAGR